MKVKNLYWDEIQPTYEETTPTWFREAVEPIPSFGDLRAAVEACQNAFERYDADIIAGKPCDDSKAAYLRAIEQVNLIRFQREQAALREVIK